MADAHLSMEEYGTFRGEGRKQKVYTCQRPWCMHSTYMDWAGTNINTVECEMCAEREGNNPLGALTHTDRKGKFTSSFMKQGMIFLVVHLGRRVVISGSIKGDKSNKSIKSKVEILPRDSRDPPEVYPVVKLPDYYDTVESDSAVITMMYGMEGGRHYCVTGRLIRVSPTHITLEVLEGGGSRHVLLPNFYLDQPKLSSTSPPLKFDLEMYRDGTIFKNGSALYDVVRGEDGSFSLDERILSSEDTRQESQEEEEGSVVDMEDLEEQEEMEDARTRGDEEDGGGIFYEEREEAWAELQEEREEERDTTFDDVLQKNEDMALDEEPFVPTDGPVDGGPPFFPSMGGLLHKTYDEEEGDFFSHMSRMPNAPSLGQSALETDPTSSMLGSSSSLPSAYPSGASTTIPYEDTWEKEVGEHDDGHQHESEEVDTNAFLNLDGEVAQREGHEDSTGRLFSSLETPQEQEFREAHSLRDMIPFPRGFFEDWSEEERSNFAEFWRTHQADIPPGVRTDRSLFNGKLTKYEWKRAVEIYINKMKLRDMNILNESFNFNDLRGEFSSAPESSRAPRVEFEITPTMQETRDTRMLSLRVRDESNRKSYSESKRKKGDDDEEEEDDDEEEEDDDEDEEDDGDEYRLQDDGDEEEAEEKAREETGSGERVAVGVDGKKPKRRSGVRKAKATGERTPRMQKPRPKKQKSASQISRQGDEEETYPDFDDEGSKRNGGARTNRGGRVGYEEDVNIRLQNTEWGKNQSTYSRSVLHTYEPVQPGDYLFDLCLQNDIPIPNPIPPLLRATLHPYVLLLYRHDDYDTYASTWRRSHIAYDSGAQPKGGFVFKGFTVELNLSMKGFRIRIARAMDVDVASILYIASAVDTRLQSQQSMSMWIDWIVRGGDKAVQSWLDSPGLMEQLNLFKKARLVEGTGRKRNVADKARSLLATKEGYDFQKDAQFPFYMDQRKKNPARFSPPSDVLFLSDQPSQGEAGPSSSAPVSDGAAEPLERFAVSEAGGEEDGEEEDDSLLAEIM